MSARVTWSHDPVRRLDALVLSDTAVALHPDDPVAALLFAQIREQGWRRSSPIHST